MEGVQSFLDGLLIVVHSTALLATLQQSFDHHRIVHVKEKQKRTIAHVLLELNCLIHFARIAIDQEALRRAVLGLHCVPQQSEHFLERHEFATVKSGGTVISQIV